MLLIESDSPNSFPRQNVANSRIKPFLELFLSVIYLLHYKLKFVIQIISTASYFWGLAAITGSQVKIKYTSMQSIQGDIQFVKVLKNL